MKGVGGSHPLPAQAKYGRRKRRVLAGDRLRDWRREREGERERQGLQGRDRGYAGRDTRMVTGPVVERSTASGSILI